MFQHRGPQLLYRHSNAVGLLVNRVSPNFSQELLKSVPHPVYNRLNMLRRDEIKRRRELLGLTLDEAAKRAGFEHRQRWYAIEVGDRDNISVQTLEAIASALGCSLDDLVKRKRGGK